MILFCLGAADALVRMEYLGSNRRRCAALALCLVAAALTHYFAAGAIVALALYAAIRKIRKAATPFAAAAVGGILLWGWEFFRQIRSLPAAEPDFLVSSDLHHSTTAALEMIGLCGQWLVGSAYAAMLPAAVMVILLVVTILWPLVRLPWRKDALLWLLWIGGTALPVAGSDLFHHTTFLEYLRYTILASPAAYAAARFDRLAAPGCHS